MTKNSFEAKEDYGEWAGSYEVKALSASEHLKVEDEYIRVLGEKGLTVSAKEISSEAKKTYLGLRLLASVRRNGEKLSYTSPSKLLDEMPARLYILLTSIDQRLNAVSVEEQDFLAEK